MTLAALAIIPVAPLAIAYYFTRLDSRGRAFVDAANTRLLMIEGDWQRRFPDNAFSTYTQQFGVLTRRDEALVERYAAARKLGVDAYPSLVQAPSAHASEASIIRLFFWVWMLLFAGGVLHFVWHAFHPGLPAP